MAMESTEIEEILKILIEDEELIKNWKGLADSLGLGIEDSVSLKNLYKQSTTTATDFFSEILNRWRRSVKGQGATMAKLVETLKGLEFKGIAEKIEATLNIANKAELLTNPIEHDVLKWNASIEDILKNGETGALSIELLNGKYKEALKKFTEVHKSQKSTLGKDHPTTLYTGNYMAEILFHLDRNDEALELYNSILESEKKVLGETHEDTIKTKENIGAILLLQGKYTESMKLYEDALEWRTTALGEEHQLTLAARHNIGHYLYQEKEFTKAKGIFEDVLELRLKVFGEEDSETLLTKGMLASTLDALGESEEGLRMLKAVLVSQENVLGIQHPDTIITRKKMDIISAQSVTKTDPTVLVSGSTGNTTTTTGVGSTFTRSGSSRTRGSTTVPPDTEVPTNTVAELPGLNRETLDKRMATTIPSLAEKDQGGQNLSGDEQQPPKKKYKSQ